MVPLLIALAIAVIVAWFLWWALDELLPHIPLPGQIAAFLRVLARVIIVAIILFYFVIPILRMVPGAFHL